jgi:dTDP-glucose 4,6-dehydratase
MAVERGDNVLNVDRRRKSNPVPALAPLGARDGYARLEADATDRALMRALVREFAPDAIVHLAAPEGDEPDALVGGEIGGAFSMIEAARAWFETAPKHVRERFRFIHVERAESDIPEPLSRAQAARCAASTLIDRWSQATGLPVVTCVAGETFGPWQARSSLLSRMLASLMHAQPFTLPDAGGSVRDWLPVRDLAAGILAAADTVGATGRIDFSVGAERRDIDVAESICGLLDERMPRASGAAWLDMVTSQGESRAALSGPMLDSGEAERLIGWTPLGFHAGLDRLVSWTIASYHAARTQAVPLAAE